MSVTTIATHRFRSGRRFSLAEQLFLDHQTQLIAFVAHRAPETDHHTVEDLVQDTGLPDVLKQAARVAIYRHLKGQLAEEPAPSSTNALGSRVAA